jgi:drug/metabolite transporter (DMT)-like permease
MKKAFIQLHIAVFLAGFTGILGKLISLNEGLLVWYRLMITALTLWIINLVRKTPLEISTRDLLKVFGLGGIAALHWVCFYGSIKYSNVSIGLVCFSAVGFFTALLEPVLLGVKMNKLEFALGLLVIAGICCIFHFDPHYKTGIIIGLVSALLGSIFPIGNRYFLRRLSVDTLTVFELSGGFLFLSLLLPFYLKWFPTTHSFPDWQDWIWLLILSWFCSVLAFTLSNHALKLISAFTVNLSFTLEPVYGILLAFLVLGENKYLNGGFFLGLSIILLAILLQMGALWFRRKKNVPGD